METASRSREYNIWAMMRQRCTNPNAANYNSYGGRGISVCERWELFSHFIEDMGPAPSPKHTLDRVDGTGNYTPENCRWADVETQQNNRRNAVKIKAFGEELSIAQWARKTGLTRDQVKHRVFVMNMPPEEALSAPRMGWVQRPVLQLGQDGSHIRQWDSYAAVKREFPGGSVWNALSGRSKSAYGFLWRYVE